MVVALSVRHVEAGRGRWSCRQQWGRPEPAGDRVGESPGALRIGGRDVAELAVQARVVEPAEVLDDGDLGFEARCEDAALDELALERCDEALGHRIVIPVGDRPDRRRDPEVLQALGVAHARVLGGFNRSSQHLDRGGCGGQASGMDEGADGPVADEVAGRAVAAA